MYCNTILLLKELSHGILSYFEHRKNYCKIEGNLKIILYKDRKIPKRLQQSIKEQGWLRMEKIDTHSN